VREKQGKTESIAHATQEGIKRTNDADAIPNLIQNLDSNVLHKNAEIALWSEVFSRSCFLAAAI